MKKRLAMLAIVAVLASGCTMMQNDNYRVDTNGPTTVWITITGRTTAQIGQVYQLVCGGNVNCLADNLKNVNIPEQGHYEVCYFAICYSFTFEVKATWNDDLDHYRDQLNANIYGILLIGSNVDTGGPCLRAINDVGLNGLSAAGWGHADKLTSTCPGGNVFS